MPLLLPVCTFGLCAMSGCVNLGGIGLLVSENMGVAVEITSISAAIAKLLLLPVWALISTSGLQMPLHKVSIGTAELVLCEKNNVPVGIVRLRHV